MAIELLNHRYVTHRGSVVAWVAHESDRQPCSYLIDNIERIVCGFAHPDGVIRAWIVPNYSFDEEVCEDIGPFDTAEDALVYLKLTATMLDR